MDDTAVTLRYVDYLRTGDDAILEEAFAPDFLDHVSGRRGVEIMRIVRGWIAASFADAVYEVHGVTTGGGLVMLWFSSRARHVGNAFPQFAGREPTGRVIVAEAVHIFRVVDGRLAEHWAVRDDLGVQRQIDSPDPLDPTRDRPHLT
ncbi:ester cyclase [Kribbella albertanoniae]